MSVKDVYEVGVAGIGLSPLLNLASTKQTLADDGTYDLPDASTGMGFLIFGDESEWGWFTWKADGTVTIQSSKDANLVAANTDTKYCIFDNGTTVRIRNRSGSASVLRLFAFY